MEKKLLIVASKKYGDYVKEIAVGCGSTIGQATFLLGEIRL